MEPFVSAVMCSLVREGSLGMGLGAVGCTDGTLPRMHVSQVGEEHHRVSMFQVLRGFWSKYAIFRDTTRMVPKVSSLTPDSLPQVFLWIDEGPSRWVGSS